MSVKTFAGVNDIFKNGLEHHVSESWCNCFSRGVNFQYVWREFWEYDGRASSQLVRSNILQALFATPPFTMPKAMKAMKKAKKAAAPAPKAMKAMK